MIGAGRLLDLAGRIETRVENIGQPAAYDKEIMDEFLKELSLVLADAKNGDG